MTRRRSSSTLTLTSSGRTATDHLRRRQVLAPGAGQPRALPFTSDTDKSTRSRPRTTNTVVIHMKRPDAPDRGRPVHLHPPQDVWGKGPVEDADRLLQAVAALWSEAARSSSPTSSGTESRRWRRTGASGAGAEVRRDPVLRSPTRTPPSGRSRSARSTWSPRSAAGFARLGDSPTSTTPQASSPAYMQMAFNICSVKVCPHASYNRRSRTGGPPGQRPMGSTASAPRDRCRGTSFEGPRILPSFYKSFYEVPAAGLPVRPGQGQADPRRCGLAGERRRAADQGRGTSLVQPLRSLRVAYDIQAAKLVAEEAAGRDRLRRPGGHTDKLYDLTRRKVNGSRRRTTTPSSGVGRGPVRPELPAQHPDHRRDRRLV